MDTFRYFAYGSNILSSRLRRRCPSAAFVGIAEATGFELAFTKPSIDKSGKATVLKTDSRDNHVVGAVYKITETHRGNLDRAEGPDYRRDDKFYVRYIGTGDHVVVSTYVSCKIQDGLRPYDWYLALIVAGMNEFGFPRVNIVEVKTTAYEVDNILGRESRLDAIKAMESAGIDDYRAILPGLIS